VEATEALADEITTLAAHLSAATARWLALIAEFDGCEGWGASGCKSCAAWLSWSCGLAPLTAREHVRVARRLGELPLVAAAFGRGELSYSKVRALTRVEEVEDEAELVSLARHATAGQLERIVRGYRSVLAVEEGAERAFAERSVSWSWEDDGTLLLRGRLPGEQGALLVAALEAARDTLGPPPPEDDDPPGVSAETPESGVLGRADRAPTISARNADALLALAETSPAGHGRGANADRYMVVVHVDADALSSPPAGGGRFDLTPRAMPAAAPGTDPARSRCELDAGVPLPFAAARRLTCDASLVRIIERDGRPLSVGRRTRAIPPALHRALRARADGCAFPGCTQTRHLDVHHIRHWADGGRTDADNLVQLCRHHHRLLHEGGFSMRRSRTGAVFFAPDGRPLPASPRPPRGEGAHLLARNRRAHVHVSAETPTSLGRGEHVDLGLAVDALLQIAMPSAARAP
jgi:uncharacterized protein DUF222/HNH endonuclease